MSSINFVSADSIEEAKKARQEEWEKAYKNKENPPPLKEEEPYDPRTLYERLQEQKQKKDDAFAEATKFGNLIHRIDNDEFDFLNTLEDEEAKKKKELAEQEDEELKKFRMNVQIRSAPPLSQPSSSLDSITSKPAMASVFSPTSFAPKKKSSLFAGLVKRDNSISSTSTASPSSSSSKSPASSSTTSVEQIDSKATAGKRKAGEDEGSVIVTATVKGVENKKAKVDSAQLTSSAAAKPKPNALLSLAAYDSSSDDDE